MYTALYDGMHCHSITYLLHYEKTDPYPFVKKKIGTVPRDSSIDLDPKCEENFKTISQTDLTEDFDYIFDGPALLPPCEPDIRS